MARDELWDALKDHAKQVHSERVAKNPDRIAYAIQQFEAHSITSFTFTRMVSMFPVPVRLKGP